MCLGAFDPEWYSLHLFLSGVLRAWYEIYILLYHMGTVISCYYVNGKLPQNSNKTTLDFQRELFKREDISQKEADKEAEATCIFSGWLEMI